jgi:hypothetical protein
MENLTQRGHRNQLASMARGLEVVQVGRPSGRRLMVPGSEDVDIHHHHCTMYISSMHCRRCQPGQGQEQVGLFFCEGPSRLVLKK